ncbi:PLP-dependent transferase [Aspergillus coremiiformis]|uniref:PLP-dependent transferase n=1 Tax=Aspergillus coremiiformis TaxID=138285 RepID=A0A5N6Z8U0_9EURO|nr:PLP-dependent transferase [Aspergillus coremiiformis]
MTGLLQDSHLPGGYNVDAIRETEYPMLKGEVYLDHTGATVYSQSSIKAFADELKHNLYGNPHSASRSSRHCTGRVDEIRRQTLDFFHADPEHFDLVFVQNATNAVKLVVQALKDQPLTTPPKKTFMGPRFWVGYHVESHTSIVGARELADAGSHCFTTEEEVDRWLDSGSAKEDVDRVPSQSSKTFQVGLFSFPGQSNLNGHRLPLNWPGRLRRSPLSAHQKIYTLWDAAALASTSPLDFSDPAESPDFTVVSFYKIFGFPDLGGLIVRKASASILTQRPYFGGGTVEMVVAAGCSWHSAKTGHVHEALEDGTVPFHDIIALGNALTAHQQLYGSQENVSQHTASLAAKCYTFLSSLRHPNGSNVCEVYRDPAASYGPTIAFNLKTIEGDWVMLSKLEQAANEHHIHLRTGDVCNPGGIAKVLQLEPWELLRNYAAGIRCGCKNIIVGSKPSGVARISFGAMSTMGDLEAFMRFVKNTYASGLYKDTPRAPLSLPDALLIEKILVYPIQGCGAYHVKDKEVWNVTAAGLQWDRQWCLVDLQNRSILTQQKAPRLVLVSPEIDSKQGTLTISLHRSLKVCPTLPRDITVPLSDAEKCKEYLPSNEISVWDDSTAATIAVSVLLSPEIETFFTAALGVHCTLGKVRNQECLLLPSIIPQMIIPSVTVERDSRMEREQETSTNGDIVSPPTVSRPQHLALAETLRTNILLTSGTTHHDQRWHYLRMGKRYIESGSNPCGERSAEIYHLARMQELDITAQGRSADWFQMNTPLIKVAWKPDAGTVNEDYAADRMVSIRTQQTVQL